MEYVIGQKLGELTIKDFRGKKSFLCVCSCGNEKLIYLYMIKRYKHQSCGASFHKEKYKKGKCWRGCGDLGHTRFSWIKKGAEYRKLEFSLTIEYLWDLFLKQNKKCSLSGVDLNIKHGENASVDRIDNTKGYIVGNVQWVHKDVNFMKGCLTQNEFIKYCKMITYERNRYNK